jgi:hypothetical protein
VRSGSFSNPYDPHSKSLFTRGGQWNRVFLARQEASQ